MLIKSLTKVDKLTKRVEQTFEERQYYEDLQKRQEEREKLIRESPQWTKTDFYCGICREDILGCSAFKVIQSDWSNPNQRIAYYESFKACHKGLRRRITDKQQDPYYRDSQMLKEQRLEAIAKGDLLQPYDYGFTTKYGNPNKKKWDKLEQEERANFSKKIMHSV